MQNRWAAAFTAISLVCAGCGASGSATGADSRAPNLDGGTGVPGAT
jgi:hypothetical protein